MFVQARKPKPDVARKFAAMAEKVGATVPAAWPSGLSQLSQTYEVCRRCDADKLCADWLKKAPDSVQLPPEFCPNGAEFARLNKAKFRA